MLRCFDILYYPRVWDVVIYWALCCLLIRKNYGPVEGFIEVDEKAWTSNQSKPKSEFEFLSNSAEK